MTANRCSGSSRKFWFNWTDWPDAIRDIFCYYSTGNKVEIREFDIFTLHCTQQPTANAIRLRFQFKVTQSIINEQDTYRLTCSKDICSCEVCVEICLCYGKAESEYCRTKKNAVSAEIKHSRYFHCASHFWSIHYCGRRLYVHMFHIA